VRGDRKIVAAHHHCLRAAAAAQAASAVAPEAPAPVPLPAAARGVSPGRTYRLAERTRTRYAEVQECLSRGLSRAADARELNLDIQTVRRFANATCAEELLGKAEHRSTKLDPYSDLVNQRWNEGVTSAAAITAELRVLGFKGDARPCAAICGPSGCPEPALVTQTRAAQGRPGRPGCPEAARSAGCCSLTQTASARTRH
jgi:hypothetical protein